MIKKTKSNFSIVVSILQNQAYYNYYVACDKANEIFKRVQTERKSGLAEGRLLYANSRWHRSDDSGYVDAECD